MYSVDEVCASNIQLYQWTPAREDAKYFRSFARLLDESADDLDMLSEAELFFNQ